MKEDISPFARQPKTLSLPNPTHPYGVLCDCRVRNNFCSVLLDRGYTGTHVKQASNSQDTVDLYTTKGSKKK